MHIRLLAAAALALGIALPAKAAVLYAFEETGAGVVGTLSGSIDTTGIGFADGSKFGAFVTPSTGAVLSGADGDSAFDFFAITAAVPFGPGGMTSATATTGDLFAIVGTSLALARGYVSGTALDGSLSFAGATFASLGITPGSYVLTLPSDTATLSFTVAALPLPATLPLLAGALALGGLLSRRLNARARPRG